MADKEISSLPKASEIYDNDSFVLSQGGAAKQLEGKTLRRYVTVNVMTVDASPLPAGSTATAVYDRATGTLLLGIPAGADGRDFAILGYYDTVEALQAAVPAPGPGDTYGVGAAAPYDIYIWDATAREWVNNGNIQGPANTLGIGTVTSGDAAAASITGAAPNQTLNLVLPRGEAGDDAPVITQITVRQSDYHLIIAMSDGTSYDAGYCRGAEGPASTGTGDMMASIYDPKGKAQDIFGYVDGKIEEIPTPDMSAQIQEHNKSATAHGDIRSVVANKQDKITASGILKGNGSGGVSAAEAGTDYATPASVAAAKAKAVTAVLLASGWTEDAAGLYAQTVNVEGVTVDAAQVIVVDVQLTGTDADADSAALAAWCGTNGKGPSGQYVTQANGTLTFHAVEAPDINIPINAGVG